MARKKSIKNGAVKEEEKPVSGNSILEKVEFKPDVLVAESVPVKRRRRFRTCDCN